MTKEKLKELDIYICEKVMGESYLIYSNNIFNAWMVIEKMKRSEFRIRLEIGSITNRCEVYRKNRDADLIVSAMSTSIEVAICLAAKSLHEGGNLQ